MTTRKYELKKGEAVKIFSHIDPKDENEVIVIVNATYRIKKNGDLIREGNLTINETNLSFLFEAEEKGTYEIEEKVTIGAETFISCAIIFVR